MYARIEVDVPITFAGCFNLLFNLALKSVASPDHQFASCSGLVCNMCGLSWFGA